MATGVEDLYAGPMQLLQAGGGFAPVVLNPPDRSWTDMGTPRGIPALGAAMENQL